MIPPQILKTKRTTTPVVIPMHNGRLEAAYGLIRISLHKVFGPITGTCAQAVFA
jgi:hypothetical protein